MLILRGTRIKGSGNLSDSLWRHGKKSLGDDTAKALFSCLSSSYDSSRRRSRNNGGNLPLRLISLSDTRGVNGLSRNVLNAGQYRQVSWLPEAVQNFSIWGGTGYALKVFHFDGAVPYWACFAFMSTALRTALLPMVVHSAKTSARFAKVAPELQFIVTLFQSDLKKMRAEGKSLFEQRQLFLQNLQTVRTIYKLHNINPLVVFLSPLFQIPFFYYVAIDLRKIVNGADPELAQELTESPFLWITDLTEADPFYGLPIAAGAMLYLNVEVAVGRRSLSGPTASKSDFASLLKDLFQTLAVLMPCLAANSPAGLQVYLLSSFTWTLFQGAGLRNDTVRGWIGLPSMSAAPTEAKYAKEFMEFKKLEQKAKEIRGDGPILGRNVLAVGFETSFPGTNRPSTIETSGQLPPDMMEEPSASLSSSTMKKNPTLDVSQATAAWAGQFTPSGGEFIHGISAPMAQLEAQFAEQLKEQQMKEITAKSGEEREYMSRATDEMMEAANRGVIVVPKEETKPQIPDSARHDSKRKPGSPLRARDDGRDNHTIKPNDDDCTSQTPNTILSIHYTNTTTIVLID
jgi:membrane protein insertase Oxa1/YidC/SpoIIIJ